MYRPLYLVRRLLVSPRDLGVFMHATGHSHSIQRIEFIWTSRDTGQEEGSDPSAWPSLFSSSCVFNMSCNAFGFGALNVFWIVYGILLIAMTLASLDCTAAIAAYIAVERECSDLERFFNAMWCLTRIGWALTAVLFAFLPKCSKRADAANKFTMLVITVLWSVTMSIMAIALANTSIDDTRLPRSAVAVDVAPILLAILAMIVHREPSTQMPLWTAPSDAML